MQVFDKIYAQLNEEQQKAVDTIDGPLLVLAGPGTGKTQLLSARVANILRTTDTLPQNILCLTFTDAAARTMRERLVTMIGDAAYDVQINTYHSFSSDIIRSYPDFFQSIDLETGEESRLERPISELGQLKILSGIVSSLPFTDPLRSARHYLRSVVSTIADLKQANIRPEGIKRLAEENATANNQLSPAIHDVLSGRRLLPRKAGEAQALFGSLLPILENNPTGLAQDALRTLRTALVASETENSTRPLTAWKNQWLTKDADDNWRFGDPENTRKLLSLAQIYKKYQDELARTNQYDFHDMILQTIHALSNKPELRYTLQERFQYLLLDEFQDTNAAQFELVKLLADHPVHEGRPNIMAVGDDDQGIYAFQGADIGNMLGFLAAFRDVHVINLVRNYRSHHDILHLAHNIAAQIESRLHHNLRGITKDIVAASDSLPAKAKIARHEFDAQAAEFGWIADSIAEQIKTGMPAEDIAVLAPRHAILESLVPFLNARGIPVSYERREDIFSVPIIQSLLLMSECLLAINGNDGAKMDELLPKVLSLDFWGLPTELIWSVNWSLYDAERDTYTPWARAALSHSEIKQPVSFLLSLGSKTDVLGLEEVLDYMTGAKAYSLDGEDYTSPFKSFYFSETSKETTSLQFYEAISHLSVIRSILREQQATTEQRLGLDAFVQLQRMYQEAEQPLINTHPIAQSASAVQLATVYKAKGLEYGAVYLPCLSDDVWGSTARSSGNKITLPYNLRHIRHESGGDDDSRRLLFVAITRAKKGLVLTSHALKESGKMNLPVKYMHESGEGDMRIARVMPPEYQQVIATQRTVEQLRIDVDTLWHTRHVRLQPELRSLLQERLSHYVMGPTHLNSFTNVEYDGPQTFLLNTLLRFPEAPTPDGQYGNALHRALERYQKESYAGSTPTLDVTIDWFTAILKRSRLDAQDEQIYLERGARALKSYLQTCGKRLQEAAEIERDFRREGVTLEGARLTGIIDRLEVDSSAKTVRIVDFKSGNPSSSWSSSSKHQNYKQQLYFYMLLVERSQSYRGYHIESASLEFIEPLPSGDCASPLVLPYDETEYAQFKRLIVEVWQRIQRLDLPDISGYAASAAGMRHFITDLLEE